MHVLSEMWKYTLVCSCLSAMTTGCGGGPEKEEAKHPPEWGRTFGFDRAMQCMHTFWPRESDRCFSLPPSSLLLYVLKEVCRGV